MQNMIWTSEQIGEALSLNLETNDKFGKVQFNSRDIEKGDIFIALKGGARDGHEFVLDAFARGAGLAIVSQDIKNAPANARSACAATTLQARSRGRFAPEPPFPDCCAARHRPVSRGR